MALSEGEFPTRSKTNPQGRSKQPLAALVISGGSRPPPMPGGEPPSLPSTPRAAPGGRAGDAGRPEAIKAGAAARRCLQHEAYLGHQRPQAAAGTGGRDRGIAAGGTRWFDTQTYPAVCEPLKPTLLLSLSPVKSASKES